MKNSIITDPRLKILPFLIGLIGVGSGLYHTFNNPYTLIIDLLPIYFFIIFSLFTLLRKIFENILIAYSLSSTLVLIQLLSL
ncbi:MAG: hypothetical protein AAB768_01785, partial [Patescibacteria group bacterium]